MCAYVTCMYMYTYVCTHTHVDTRFVIENMTVDGTDTVFSIPVLSQVREGHMA